MKAGSGMPVSFFSLTRTYQSIYLPLARNKNTVFALVVSILSFAWLARCLQDQVLQSLSCQH